MTYTLNIIGPKTVTGTLAFVWMPTSYIGDSTLTTYDKVAQYHYQRVIEVQGPGTYSVTIPFVHYLKAKETVAIHGLATTSTPDQGGMTTTNGFWGLYVVNPLVASSNSAPPSVNINVLVQPGDDFELAVPTGKNVAWILGAGVNPLNYVPGPLGAKGEVKSVEYKRHVHVERQMDAKKESNPKIGGETSHQGNSSNSQAAETQGEITEDQKQLDAKPSSAMVAADRDTLLEQSDELLHPKVKDNQVSQMAAHFGDATMDLYTLCKRWQPLIKITTATSASDMFIVIPVTPVMPAWDTNDSAYYSGCPNLSGNYLSVNSLLFREWVGDLRYKVVVKRGSPAAGASLTMQASFVPFMEAESFSGDMSKFYVQATGRGGNSAETIPMFWCKYDMDNPVPNGWSVGRWSAIQSMIVRYQREWQLNGTAYELNLDKQDTSLAVTVPFFDNHRVELTQRFWPTRFSVASTQTDGSCPVCPYSSCTGYLIFQVSRLVGAVDLDVFISAGDNFQFSIPMGGTTLYFRKDNYS